MADVKAASAALDRIEGILRSRYRYEHPIFEHVAAARAALEATAPKAKVAEEAVTSGPGATTTAGPTDSNAASAASPEPEKRAQGKRGSA